jgi:putative transposase
MESNHPIRERRHRLDPAAYLGTVAVSFTACIEGRRAALADPRLAGAFQERLRVTADKHACNVLVYCFMPDHVHVLLAGRTPQADTRKAFIAFKQATGYWMARERPGFGWQKGFYDRILRTEADVISEIRYVVANPVRKELAQDWRDFPCTGSFVFDMGDLVPREGSAG